MLETFDATTDFDRRNKPAVLNIHPDGRFSFSCEAVKLLELNAGDKIAFAYDEKDKQIIFFFKSETGIALQETKTCGGQTRLIFACRPIARKLLKFFGVKNVRSFSVKNETTKIENNIEAWFILKN